MRGQETSVAAAAGSSRRAQPVRQTRTNPPRSSATVSRPFAGRSAALPQESLPLPPRGPPGFFPAITHFTDCMAAMPKEIVRHFTLLKEVDAKACGPEEILDQITRYASQLPPPAHTTQEAPNGLLTNGAAVNGNAPGVEQPLDAEADLPRRHLFYNLRLILSELLPTLDEKNHVISTANEALNKQLARMDTSLPYIDNEISEEGRLGSMTHWAYKAIPEKRNGVPVVNERPRREQAGALAAAAAAAVLDEQAAAARSESRREAMLAKKRGQQEMDADDPRYAGPAAGGKKTQAARGRKTADNAAGGVGLGIVNGAASNPPQKKRKTEKAAANSGTGTPMERSVSAQVSKSGAAAKGNAASPRSTPVLDGPKKRARGGIAAAGTTRKRNNTNASGNPPSIASSPVTAAFATKDIPRSSPVPGPSGRPSARARQNSNQSTQDPRRRPSSSASNKPTPGSGLAMTVDLPTANGRRVSDARPTTASNAFPDPSSYLGKTESRTPTDKDIPVTDAPSVRHTPDHINTAHNHAGTLADGNWPLKREDAELPSTQQNSGTVSNSAISNSGTRGGSRASKNSTPIAATFADASANQPQNQHSGNINHQPLLPPQQQQPQPQNQRQRPSRDAATTKRSHKKGAGLAAQMAAASAVASGGQEEGENGGVLEGHGSAPVGVGIGAGAGAGPSIGAGAGAGAVQTEEDDDDDDDDESEPRYCYCNGVSYGEMVACDSDTCPLEWFHLDCVGLAKAPTKNAKWYCDQCKEDLRKGKVMTASR
ncbi:MAG: hypothetical protein M1825_003964 [Sarcosagium campestre]|nr:MAG: hypothetical protein M1825_003964 [Sarcosagium campestre]